MAQPVSRPVSHMRRVVVLVGAAAALWIVLKYAWPPVFRTRMGSPESDARAHLQIFRSTALEYEKQERRLPGSLDELLASGVFDIASEADRRQALTASWGTPSGYEIRAGKPDFRSAGPDTRFVTEDDIFAGPGRTEGR